MRSELGFLGLLNKAGNLAFGGMALNQLGREYALILAFDASENTKKSVLSKARGTLLTGVSKEELGSALGFDELSFVLVMDKKSADALAKKWRKGDSI